MALDREFGAMAIAMALGKKYMLKRKVKDPETGKEIWVEHKPDIGMVQILGFSGNSTDRPHASTVEVLSVVGPMAGSETLVAVKAQYV